jgi:calcineurin-like phosphoesterase
VLESQEKGLAVHYYLTNTRHITIDFIIANAENAAGGRGLTRTVMGRNVKLEIDVWTMEPMYGIIRIYLILLNIEKAPGSACQLSFRLYGTGLRYLHVGYRSQDTVNNAMGRVFYNLWTALFRV